MNIRVDLNTPIKDGTEVVFRSPVDCSQVTGLKVYYLGEGGTASKEFAFADAHGNNVGDIDHLFAENVVVKVILDVTTGMAFVQNADTNAYLEGCFQELSDRIGRNQIDVSDRFQHTLEQITAESASRQAADNAIRNVLMEVKAIADSNSESIESLTGGNPTIALTPALLTRMFKPSFYTTLPGAVADLNAGAIGANADATADNAVCALYTDYAGNACLILLSDIDLDESIKISVTSIFKVNGYTINYSGDYSIAFEGNNCVFDLQVDGSKLVKDVENVAAMVVMVGFSGSNCQLLGGCINYTAAGASQPLCAVVVKGICSIRNLDTTVELISSDKQVYGIQVATNGNADIVGTNVSVKSDSSGCFGVYCLASSVGCSFSKCKIIAESKTSAAQGCYCASTTYTTVVDECVIHSSASKKAATGIVLTAGVAAKVVNSDIFADGTTGSNNDTVRGASVGISNNGTLDIENCTVFGTQSGVACRANSITTINGGTYDSCSHGGVYIACVDGNFYAQNATFRNVPYRGKYKEQFNYSGAVYLVAAVYIGGSSTANNIKAYMDNCILDGCGPELAPDGDGFIGAEPVRFRASLGEKNNAIYASNCTFTGDGKIRFGNSSHHLYLGFGNRVLCEANLPDCVDTTTYAKKIFTSYEEE